MPVGILTRHRQADDRTETRVSIGSARNSCTKGRRFKGEPMRLKSTLVTAVSAVLIVGVALVSSASAASPSDPSAPNGPPAGSTSALAVSRRRLGRSSSRSNPAASWTPVAVWPAISVMALHDPSMSGSRPDSSRKAAIPVVAVFPPARPQ